MRMRDWVSVALVALVAGCAGDDGGGAPATDAGSDVAKDSGGGLFDDTGSFDPIDAGADTATPDALGPDAAGPDVAEPDGGTPDVEAPDVGPQDDGTNDVDHIDDVEPADAGGDSDASVPTEIPVGGACTPEGLPCVAGASCVPTAQGAAASQCYEDLQLGAPCGPGLGGCAPEADCVVVGGQSLCAVAQPAGGACDDAANPCKAGLSCEEVGAILTWEPGATWTPDAALAPGFVGGRIAVGPENRIHVVDETAERIVALDGAGATLLVIGDGTFGPVKALQDVTGLTPAPNGTIMAVDAMQRWLVAYHLDGPVSNLMAGPGTGAQQLQNDPDDVAAMNGGKWVWASEPAADRVKVYKSTGAFVGNLGQPGLGDGQLTAPTTLWAESDGVWVADAGGRLQRFGEDLGWKKTIALPTLGDGSPLVPADFFVGAEGRFFVADAGGGVLILDADGALIMDIGAPLLEAPAGIAPWWDGAFIVSDAALGQLAVFEPVRETLCVAPANLGKPCGAGIGPCIQGATCVPTALGAGSGTCVYFADQGEDCGVPFVECAGGLTCVAPEFEGQPSLCLPVAGSGAPCGPGLAGCAPENGCAWSNAAHDALICLPRAVEGALCNVYGVGGCVAGTACVTEFAGSYTWRCKPIAGPVAPCGPGIASCNEGYGCNFETTTFKKKNCYKDGGTANECGIVNAGLCGPGTSCVWQTPEELVSQCYANGGAGAKCGDYGTGDCLPGTTCLLESPQTTKNICKPNDTTLGQPCAVNGLPLCAPGGDCLIDAPGSAGAHCYPQIPLGEPCGAGVGLCQLGGDCLITNEAALLGECVPAHPYGQPCGEGLGLCADAGVCVCSDPFATVCPGNACIPPVGVPDLCAVNSVLTTPGWVGYCPTGFTCAINDLVLYDGGSTVNEAHTINFRCLPISADGGPCGPLVAGCDTGLQCLVNGQPQTLETVLNGQVGTCAP